jgi:hypothetical protein
MEKRSANRIPSSATNRVAETARTIAPKSPISFTGASILNGRAGDATSLARSARLVDDPSVLIFLLLGYVPWVLVLALAIVMWLTVVELLEWRPHYVWWFWWLLLVFMTNFVGYLFLRAYRVYQRWSTRTG